MQDNSAQQQSIEQTDFDELFFELLSELRY